jgi:hypothetical protein
MGLVASSSPGTAHQRPGDNRTGTGHGTRNPEPLSSASGSAARPSVNPASVSSGAPGQRAAIADLREAHSAAHITLTSAIGHPTEALVQPARAAICQAPHAPPAPDSRLRERPCETACRARHAIGGLRRLDPGRLHRISMAVEGPRAGGLCGHGLPLIRSTSKLRVMPKPARSSSSRSRSTGSGSWSSRPSISP